MFKNFDEWNEIKKTINNNLNGIEIKNGDIWICKIGINVGYEIDGKDNNFSRPVLILRSYGRNGAIILPMTSKKKNNIFYFKITSGSFVNLTQIKFVDINRFERKVSEINLFKLKQIKENLNKVI